MTEKDKEFYVFELCDLGIYHINTFSAEFSNKKHAQEICDKLNSLHEENEILKKENQQLMDLNRMLKRNVQKLSGDVIYLRNLNKKD